MSFVGIIPARYASTRFPGKPLAVLGGKTVIQRVYEQVQHAVDAVYVATDDDRIAKAVEGFGGKAIMTSPDCQSGTERCWDAYRQLPDTYDAVINIQGDEPFIQPEQIRILKQCMEDGSPIATLVKPFTPDDGIDALCNPNSPKVALSADGRAIYFSRSVIPYLRGVDMHEWLNRQTYYKHIGIYAYRPDILKTITDLPCSPLELSESLEQLRWLEAGIPVKVGITTIETIGIDTPKDLEDAERFLKK